MHMKPLCVTIQLKAIEQCYQYFSLSFELSTLGSERVPQAQSSDSTVACF